MKLTIDIETFSRVNLKSAGLYRYAEDESTDILCVCWAFDDGPVHAWIPSADKSFGDDLRATGEIDGAIHFGAKIPFDLHMITTGFPEGSMEVHAWNAAFERRVLNGPAGKRYGFPEIAIIQTHCSMARSRAAGMPGRLEDAANVLHTTIRKRVDGVNAMRYLCKPRADGTRPTIVEERQRFIQLIPYCADDVRAERCVDALLPPLSPKELTVYHLDQRINDRGVLVDLEAVDNFEALIDEYKKQLKDKCVAITGGTPSQLAPLAAWLRANGCPMLENLQADSVRKLLTRDDVSDTAKTVLRLYSTFNMKAVAKFKAMRLAACKDGRIRGMLMYHAAHPGRWSSSIVQIHNLFRSVIEDPEVAIEAAKARDLDWIRALYPDVDPMKIFASCVRGCLIAAPGMELVFPDFSGIEARWNAWLFDETWLLEVYRAFDAGKGYHPYIMAYAQAFRVDPATVTKAQRFIGKVLVLSMGYQGGVGAFVKMAVNNGISLTSLVPILETLPPDVLLEIGDSYEYAVEQGRTYGLPKEVWHACEGLKILWRRAHPKIVNGWEELEFAARMAIENPGKIFDVAKKRIMFKVEDPFLVLRLPSGRKIRYFKPAISGGKITYEGVDTLTRQWQRTSTYGGKLCENEDQGGCSDLLRVALLGFDEAGFPPVMHVHDEPVMEVPVGSLRDETITRIMCTPPVWAQGFPLAVELHRGARYRK